jgi:hypothetical protein
MANYDKIVLTKRVAKQGKNNIIVIPSYLRGMIQAGSIVSVEIRTLQRADEK